MGWLCSPVEHLHSWLSPPVPAPHGWPVNRLIPEPVVSYPVVAQALRNNVLIVVKRAWEVDFGAERSAD